MNCEKKSDLYAGVKRGYYTLLLTNRASSPRRLAFSSEVAAAFAGDNTLVAEGAGNRFELGRKIQEVKLAELECKGVVLE